MDINRQDDLVSIIIPIYNTPEFMLNQCLESVCNQTYENITGDNCCLCEKCNRTIMGIFAEGEWPGEYGFPNDEKTYSKSAKLCKNVIEYDELVQPLWMQIQLRAIDNAEVINNNGYYKYISPILVIDFLKINNSFSRRKRRLQGRIVGKIKRVVMKK